MGRGWLLPVEEEGAGDAALSLGSSISICSIGLRCGPHLAENSSSLQRRAVCALFFSSSYSSSERRLPKQDEVPSFVQTTSPHVFKTLGSASSVFPAFLLI